MHQGMHYVTMISDIYEVCVFLSVAFVYVFVCAFFSSILVVLCVVVVVVVVVLLCCACVSALFCVLYDIFYAPPTHAMTVRFCGGDLGLLERRKMCVCQ